MRNLENLTVLQIILLAAPILLLQGLWIFQDAKKRGESYWLWGLFGLMSAPGSLIIYLLVTRGK